MLAFFRAVKAHSRAVELTMEQWRHILEPWVLLLKSCGGPFLAVETFSRATEPHSTAVVVHLCRAVEDYSRAVRA